ncbi:RNA polymerase subunit sigma-24 [Rouxiella badensis]|uniref:RNA polymerase subunit sigma-24 n=1 Tax=Rouxiella badensis TaxID=1646377 RepID=UPI0028D11CB1|nr:RNA polymerase subunit sigma-24 [Rouxiella badensis]
MPESFPDDLPTQFSNPRSKLPTYAHDWWDGFVGGKQPDTSALQQIPVYRSTWELYCEHTGQNKTSVGAAFFQLKQAEREYYAAVRAQYPDQFRVPQADYACMVRDALDLFNDGEKRSATGIVAGYVPADLTRAVVNRKGQRKRMRRAIDANKAHPAHVAITSRIGKQGTNSMAQDTVSMTLVRLMMEAGTQRTLSEHERRLANMEARMKELEAFKASTEKRHAIENTGQTPEQRIIQLRKQGLGYKAIHSATGVPVSTVRDMCKRNSI